MCAHAHIYDQPFGGFQIFGLLIIPRLQTIPAKMNNLGAYLQAVIKKEQRDLFASVTEVITKRDSFQALN